MLVRDYSSTPATLTPEAPLEDLGIDSLGAAELLFNVEDEFGITAAERAGAADDGRRRGGLHRRAGRRAAAAGAGRQPRPPGASRPPSRDEARRGHRPRRRLAARQRRGRRSSPPRAPAARRSAASKRLRAAGWTRRIAATRATSTAPRISTPPKLRMLDRVSQFALVAARQALAGRRGGALAGLPTAAAPASSSAPAWAARRPATTATARSTASSSDRIKPFTVLMGMHNAPAGWIGIEHGLRGPNLTYSTACSSSAVAIGEAWRRLRARRARRGDRRRRRGAALARLAEGLGGAAHAGRDRRRPTRRPRASRSRPTAAAWCSAKARRCWCSSRGSARVARGATIHGELIGYGLATDAGHITRPSVEGQAAAMRAALRSAGIDADGGRRDQRPRHRHAGQRPGRDRRDQRGVRRARARRIPVSATKSMHGHLLGAAGALECVLSLLAMRARRGAADDAPAAARSRSATSTTCRTRARRGVPSRVMLSNSFAFGGTNAVLAARRAP